MVIGRGEVVGGSEGVRWWEGRGRVIGRGEVVGG